MAGAKQHFTLNAKVEKYEDVFVGYCVELGTVTQGNSLEETCENLKDAIYVHLSVLDEIEERERVFSEKGIVVIPAIDDTVEFAAAISKKNEVAVAVYA